MKECRAEQTETAADWWQEATRISVWLTVQVVQWMFVGAVATNPLDPSGGQS